MQVTKIDRLAGIECYCTDFPGIGGYIKQNIEGFRVSELIDDRLIGDMSKTYDDSHKYPLYILEKKGLDSNHALFEIERDARIRLRVMGIKDAKAVTRQYAGTERAWENPPKDVQTRHAHIRLEGFTRKPLGKELLVGNEFEITIVGYRGDGMDGFVLQIDRIGNFYGLQRFGSERLVTHLVGREIVKRNFAQAVKLLLTYTTEYDTESSREIRLKCCDPSNYRQALRIVPKGMDIERHLLAALADGKEPIMALRAIPITIRRLYVQAYQAYIFNRCLSRAIMTGENILQPKEGDLCFEMEGPSTFGRIKKFDSNSGSLTVPAVRMAGYSFQPGKGRFETITKELLDNEQVTSKDFYIKEMQELSQQGGFRQAPLWCRDFAYGKSPLRVSFKLPKGSYATTLLRELVKPDDPIKAGF